MKSSKGFARPDQILQQAQKFASQERKLQRKKVLAAKREYINSNRYSNDPFLWEIVGFLCWIASVICLIISFFMGSWSVFFWGFILPALTGGLSFWGGIRLVAWLEVDFEAPKPEELLPTRIVPTFLSWQINHLGDELLGKGSRYASVCAQVEEVNRRARLVAERLGIRLRQHEAPYLRTGLEQAQDVVARTDHVLEGLKGFRGKVEGFLTECHGAVEALSGPLRDLELVREVQELAGQTQRLEDQAQDVVVDTVAKLQTRIAVIRGDVHKRFEGVGVHLALEASSTGDAARDLETLEKTIAGFVPADLISETKMQALQTEVGGLAM